MILLKRLYVNNFKQLQEVDLTFPAPARVLVQGKNEAGKSTLFEALYFALFGSALATESGARGLDDLIRYQVEKARVELDLQVGARLFRIRRTITRGKSNVWELDICAGDAVDEIRGNTAINKRLIAELGFDGDALLNTCFVEQKKLEKLEGLTRAKREESLAKLLNLDALVRIETELKLRLEDKQEAERLKKRADLAAIQTELPPLQQKLAHAETQLKLIELRRANTGALNETRAVQQLDAHIHALTTQRDEIAQQATRVDAVRGAMNQVKEARNASERLAENTRQIERLTHDQADARRAAESIPALQARLVALRRLTQRIHRIEQLAATRAQFAQRAAQLADAQTQLDEQRATITRAQTTLTELETQLRQAEIGAALDAWIAARREVTPPAEITRHWQAKQRARDQLARQLRVRVYGGAAALIVLVALAVASVTLAFALIAPTSLWLAILIALGAGGLAALGALFLVARAAQLWRELARASEELGQAEGEARARTAISDAQRARLDQATARLAQFDLPLPESLEQATHARAAYPTTPLDELRAAHTAAREQLLQAQTVRDELCKQHRIADDAQLLTERARAEQNAQKAARIYDTWRTRTQPQAAALAVTLDPATTQRAMFETTAQIEQAQRRANDAARSQQEIARLEEQIRALRRHAREAYEQARAVKPEAAPWDERLGSEDYNAVGKSLRAEYDALGGDQIVKRAREIEGELGRRQGERATRAQNAAQLIAQARELLARLGQPDALAESPSVCELEALDAKLQSLQLPDEASLRAQVRDLVGGVHSLQNQQTQLERELGLTGVTLDPGACRAEWEAKVRESQVRERGVEIVSHARKRIMQKVLPATMEYLRRILPLLTRERYHDAQLDPETYKIQVWDERAGNGGAFKEKNIFSGGTKDQFSLALRLGFALATLPQERGTAPSFIFLDEPLGSFDDERADALIQLLTEGEIARAFDQIFLISHVHINPRAFTHHIMLENGRVVETDLPADTRAGS